jgi:hypothetical protein
MSFFLKTYKIANDFHDVGGLLNLLYGFTGKIQKNLLDLGGPKATNMDFKLLINIALKNVYCAKK